jgi:hypothetical protein
MKSNNSSTNWRHLLKNIGSTDELQLRQMKDDIIRNASKYRHFKKVKVDAARLPELLIVSSN